MEDFKVLPVENSDRGHDDVVLDETDFEDFSSGADCGLKNCFCARHGNLLLKDQKKPKQIILCYIIGDICQIFTLYPINGKIDKLN